MECKNYLTAADTEYAERAQREAYSLRPLCVLCVSAVKSGFYSQLCAVEF